MKSTPLFILLIICFATSIVSAQQVSNVPFGEFTRQVEKEPAGFSGNKERLSTYFNQERIGLGENFEFELLKYLGDDAEKHYWISSFLISPSYLHSNKPLPYLSLLIKEQGLALLQGKHDEESVGRTVSLSVTACVLSQRLGFSALAGSHKNKSESLLLANSSLSIYVPGMSNEERRIYNAIKPVTRTSMFSNEPDDAPKAKVNGGILNGRVINKVIPSYPSEAKTAGVLGVVRVRIVFDETGKVIWARAIEGEKLLQKAAEDAAYQAQFKPVILSGTPVTVSGTLVYKFER